MLEKVGKDHINLEENNIDGPKCWVRVIKTS